MSAGVAEEFRAQVEGLLVARFRGSVIRVDVFYRPEFDHHVLVVRCGKERVLVSTVFVLDLAFVDFVAKSLARPIQLCFARWSHGKKWVARRQRAWRLAMARRKWWYAKDFRKQQLAFESSLLRHIEDLPPGVDPIAVRTMAASMLQELHGSRHEAKFREMWV